MITGALIFFKRSSVQQHDKAEEKGRPAKILGWCKRFRWQRSLAHPETGLLEERHLGWLTVRVVAVLHRDRGVLDPLHPELGCCGGEDIGFDHVQLDPDHDQKKTDGHDGGPAHGRGFPGGEGKRKNDRQAIGPAH
jgi:hypothetical protein